MYIMFFLNSGKFTRKMFNFKGHFVSVRQCSRWHSKWSFVHNQLKTIRHENDKSKCQLHRLLNYHPSK